MRRLLGSRLEIAFTVGLLAWAIIEALLIPSDWPAWERLTFALLATLPLAVRHRHPFLVLAWASAVLVLDGLLTFLPYRAVTPLPGMGVGLYAVAAYGRPRRRAVAVVAVALVAMPPLFALSEQEVAATLHDVIVFVVMLLLALSAGWAVRTRREEAERAAALATSSGAAHDQRLRRDVEAERRRIARELHAIVTRDLAAIARLAQAARAQLDADEQRALAALGAISRTTTAALDELRRLLQVLRAEGGGGAAERRGAGEPAAARSPDVGAAAPDPAAPWALAIGAAPPGRSTPSLAVAAAREHGWDVTLAERGAPLERAAGRAPAELAAGRVVEELLSAPGDGSAAVVAVRRRPDGLAVALHGRGRRPAPLRDPALLASARERARLHGGALRTRRGLRGWRIEVALPVSDASTATAVVEPDARGARAVDALIAALAFAALAVEQLSRGGDASGWISGLALIVLPLLLLRRRAPLLAACVLVLGGFCLRNELGWMPRAGVTLVAVIVFAPYAAAAHAVTVRGAIAGGVVVGAVALVTVALLIPETVLTDLPIVACVVALSWLAGWYVRGSSLLTLGLRHDERRLAEAAPERLRASLEAERARVARDLHDVVAHGVSLIGLLAAGARATLPRDPARARRALDDLDDAVAGTHVELGRLLEALRAGDEAAVGAASLADLDALASDARRAGQPIALALDRAALAAAPAGVLASACRIVQEALTNARKHADGAPVEVRLSVEHGDLLVDVRNAPPPTPCGSGAGARHGIAGMRERARLLDGELEAAPTGDGGFRVHARLPCAGSEPALALA